MSWISLFAVGLLFLGLIRLFRSGGNRLSGLAVVLASLVWLGNELGFRIESSENAPVEISLVHSSLWDSRTKLPNSSLANEVRAQLGEKDLVRDFPTLEGFDFYSLQGMGGETQPHLVFFADAQLPSIPVPHSIRCAVIPVLAADPAGFELIRAYVPVNVRAGRKLEFEWELHSILGAKGKVEFWLDEKKIGEESFEAAVGTSRRSFAFPSPEPGPHRLAIVGVEGLIPSRPDRIQAEFESLAAPLIASDAAFPWIESLLQGHGYRSSALSAESLESADLLILHRPPSRPAKLREFVERGGGLLFFAREAIPDPLDPELGSWLPLRFPVSAQTISAVQQNTKKPDGFSNNADGKPRIPPREEIQKPSRESREAGVVALALVIDKSGSMAGKKIERAREAARRTAETLQPEDYLTVLTFNQEYETVLSLQKVRQVPFLAQELAKIQAGGGTRIFPALKKAGEQLLASPASIRHLILLTDGSTEDKHSREAPYYEWVSAMAKAGITTTTVGIRGEEFDTELLSNLAVWGKGRFYPVESDRVPQIFTLEARKVRSEAENKEAQPKTEDFPTEPIPEEKAEEIPEPNTSTFSAKLQDPHPITRNILGDSEPALPPLKGYRKSQPRFGAALPLVMAENGDPLFSLWPLGQGRVGIWTADAGQGWAFSWWEDGRAQKFLLQTLEYLRRREEKSLRSWPSEKESIAPSLSREERARRIAAWASENHSVVLDDASQIPGFVRRDSVSVKRISTWVYLVSAALLVLGFLAELFPLRR